MLTIAIAIAPIFALLVLGNVLRRKGIPSFEFWTLNDKLVYWVLMPALLFHQTSTAHLDPAMVGPYAVVILGGFVVAVIYGLLAARAAKLPGPVASSLLQGASRHNTFIALAASEQLLGAEGLALAALASAMYIPVTSFVIVPCMVGLHADRSESGLLRRIVRDLATNPLILSVLAGLLANATGQTAVPVLHETTRILGSAALPIMLLSVGASLKARQLTAAVPLTLLSAVGKFLLFPTVVVSLSLLMGLTQTQMTVALIYAAVPTATSSYTLARQMGGDSAAMAAIMSLQTAMSFVTIPVTLSLVARLLGG
ncbi:MULTISPECIES: AEC family transporter [unclassified Meridianimarinicoccus]|uniref:AEC family transporter n=1 Tax=unclassified Meridianimarinicoccus TaxID=2923344 RepID=UPI001867BDC2|nr:AEC family transporter [Fluviibacterium sp. MJW13]